MHIKDFLYPKISKKIYISELPLANNNETKTSYHRFECDTSREVNYDTHLADQLKDRERKKKPEILKELDLCE